MESASASEPSRGRLGVPRFSRHAETVILWLIYSGVIAFAVFWIRQTLHDLG